MTIPTPDQQDAQRALDALKHCYRSREDFIGTRCIHWVKDNRAMLEAMLEHFATPPAPCSVTEADLKLLEDLDNKTDQERQAINRICGFVRDDTQGLEKMIIAYKKDEPHDLVHGNCFTVPDRMIRITE